jgi:hypothetical protein
VRFPNLRYGNPAELAAYVQGIPMPVLARRLRRSERSIRNWLDGRQRVPWWVPEILRLQNLEHRERMRQMGMGPLRAQLGLVSAEVVDIRRAPGQPSLIEPQSAQSAAAAGPDRPAPIAAA